MSSGCLGCREVRGEVALPGGLLLDEELVAAFHSWPAAAGLDQPVLLGHLLVMPRRHAPGWEDLEAPEAEAVGRAVARLARAQRAALDLERVYTATIGHHTPHLHVHLIPRHAGTPAELHWWQVDEWEDAPFADEPAVADAVARIRHAL
jgi:diadenosine tetraphosphate (Ap4A) HIT family hydrolase